MRLKTTALALAFLAPLPAFAQDPVAAPPAEPVPPPPVVEPAAPPPAAEMPAPVAVAAPAPAAEASSAPALKWEGLVDTYYMWNITGKGGQHQQAPALRQFDTNANSFTLNYAKLAAQVDTDLAGFRVDLGYGLTGTTINTASAGSSAMGSAALYSSGFIVQQAYATMKLGMVSVDAGKFVTTAGAEVIESNKNWLYSRSLLFYGIPLLHTGVRVNIKATDMVSVQLSAVNGWNNDADINGAKTFGANVTVTPSSATTIAATTYFGKETEGADTRFLFDLVVAQTISDTLALNLNFDYLKEGDASWFGASLMAKLGINENFYLAGRGEFVSTKDGGVVWGFAEDTSVYEGTLMAGIPWGKIFEARIEGRGDFSNKAVFSNGEEDKKNQFTILGAFLAYF